MLSINSCLARGTAQSTQYPGLHERDSLSAGKVSSPFSKETGLGHHPDQKKDNQTDCRTLRHTSAHTEDPRSTSADQARGLLVENRQCRHRVPSHRYRHSYTLVKQVLGTKQLLYFPTGSK